MAEEIELNILIIGDNSAGKTQLISNYVDGYFPSTHVATIGVEYKIKKIKYKDIEINLHIWNSIWKERFHAVTKNYLKSADGIILLYDITKRNSFDFVTDIIILNDFEFTNLNIKKILVGNSLDLEKNRQVSRMSVKKFCEKRNIKEIEVSSKLGTNVSECFELLVETIIENQTKEELLKKYGKKNKGLSIKSKKGKNSKNELNEEVDKIEGEDIKFPQLDKYISF